MGRPTLYHDGAKLCVRPTGQSKLQRNSDRRAIVEVMLENGGCMTLGEIDSHFGYDMRMKAIALLRAGWLSLCSESES
jgi:hypothetical protein